MLAHGRDTVTDTANNRRSPALLALVFGVFLLIIGVTATGQSILVSSHVTTQSLDAVVAADASLVRILVNGTLAPADLDPATISSARAAALQSELAVVASRGNILRIDAKVTVRHARIDDVNLFRIDSQDSYRICLRAF